MSTSYLAFDLGASSGRAMLGTLEDGRVSLREVHRFATPLVERGGHLYWELETLVDHLFRGLELALEAEPALRSVSVDSWAIDYVPLDDALRPLRDPYAYRDPRTRGRMAQAFGRVPAAEIYRRTGIQMLPFNTVYQLLADVEDEPELVARTATRLTIADYLHFRLSGRAVIERTMASTTQLMDVRTGDWDRGLMRALGLPESGWPEIVPPGTVLGPLMGPHGPHRSPHPTAGPHPAALEPPPSPKSGRGELDSEPVLRQDSDASPPSPGLGGGGGEERSDEPGVRATVVSVVASCSHDTGAAVAAVPADEAGPGWAYLSTGTWALLGVERAEPVLGDEARAANFTNEAGLDGTVRFLKNLMGMWVLQECEREWREAGEAFDHPTLLAEAGAAPRPAGLLELSDARLAERGGMPAKIRAQCAERGIAAPAGRGETVRLLLESLAADWARATDELERVTGGRIEVLHLVGGAARNELLCQLLADASGRSVLAGPTEATALGNVLVQARALGDLPPGVTLRQTVRASCELRAHRPRSAPAAGAEPSTPTHG